MECAVQATQHCQSVQAYPFRCREVCQQEVISAYESVVKEPSFLHGAESIDSPANGFEL